MTRAIFRFVYVVGLVLFFFMAQAAFAAPFKEIIAFGDSLTDVGNVAGLVETGDAPLVNGYYEETHYSDNMLWIETLAEYWGLAARTPGRGDSTTLPPLLSGNTWAWGGSEAASGSAQVPGVTEPIPNLLTEIDLYLASNVPSADTLYSIWSGADNLLVGGNYSPTAAKDAVSAVVTAMQQLANAGARQFLIFNLPKLGDTPAAQANQQLQIAADSYSNSYNKALSKALKTLQQDSSFKAKIYFLDIYKELELVVTTVKNGGTYTPSFFVPWPAVSIDNVTDVGLTYFNSNGEFPENYLFWDEVHPTTQGHKLIAGLALQLFSKNSKKR